jgi:hypothetical protein
MGCVMYVMILYDKLRHSLSLRRLHSLRMIRIDVMQWIPMVKMDVDGFARKERS